MKKYQIVYADPPWQFGDRLRHGSNIKNWQVKLEKSYSTMPIEFIKNIPINKITDKDCVLFLWTTDAHLENAIEVINAWGFTYKTVGFIWNKKEKSGKQVCFMGKWTCKGSEICLLATKGKIHSLIKSHKVRQLTEALRQKHSQKPDEIRNKIVELMGDIPRIELFARQKPEGWDIIEGKDNADGSGQDIIDWINKNYGGL